MTSQSGSLVLLKVGDNGGPESFATVGGMLVTSFAHYNKGVDVTSKDSGGWRELLENGGAKSMVISGSGRFEDSAAEALVRSYAIGGLIRHYEITFGNGDLLSGAFQILTYQRGGNYNGIETYTLSLASSGPITFTPAS